MSRQYSAMEVDGTVPSGASSRFDHLNAAAGDHNAGNGSFTVTAGFAFPSRGANSCGHDGCEGSYQTRVVPENSNDIIRVDIPRPTPECAVGQHNLRSRNYGQNANPGGDAVGMMTIGRGQQFQRPQIPAGGFGGQRPVVPDPPRPQTFQIHVRNFDGKTSTYLVERTTRVEVLKRMIQGQLGVPPEQQVLNFAGRNLQDGMTLEHYRVESGSTIHLTGRLRGG